MIARLCEKVSPKQYMVSQGKANIYKFKLLGHFHRPSTETLAWYDAGAAGWPKGGGQPTSETPYPVRKDSRNFSRYRSKFGTDTIPTWFNAIWWPDINTDKAPGNP
jgi:hypothetical protein